MVTLSMIMLMARLFAFSFGGEAIDYQQRFVATNELQQVAQEAMQMTGYDSWRLMNEPRRLAVIMALYSRPETRYNVSLGNALRDRDYRRAGAIYRKLPLSLPEAVQLNLAWSLENGEWL